MSNTPFNLFNSMVDLLFDRYKEASSSNRRITVVLGAGSSVWSGLGTWDTKFKDDLIAEAGQVFKNDQIFVDECWDKLSPLIGRPPSSDTERRKQLTQKASIEDIASIGLEYSVFGKRIYELLQSTFTPQGVDRDGFQPPQLAYELIAHFLKHAFIDHVVTFNFDELFDEALVNELGRDEYVSVASHHDVARQSPRLLPHLFKLHGTLSRPDTLRFTRLATTSLPALISELMDRVLLGINSEPANRTQSGAPASVRKGSRKNYLISLGYGWRDADMLRWLEARQKHVEKILIVSKKEDVNRLNKMFKAWHGQAQVVDVDLLCRVPNSAVSVDFLLWALCNELESRMNKQRVPFMPAARHILLSFLFGPNGRPGKRMNDHDALRRFVVEFVLHLAKCKGMVNLSTMAGNDRINRYYTAVKSANAALARELMNDLLTLVTSTGFINDPTLRKRSKKSKNAPSLVPTVRQSSYPDVKETYYAVAKEILDLATPLSNLNRFALNDPGEPMRAKGVITQRSGRGDEFVRNHIERIFKGPEIEVARRPGERETWTLRSATPLPTYIDLQLHTQKVLETAWTQLLVVAESGEWLTNEVIQSLVTKRTPRSILLVKAELPPLEEWPLREKIDLELSRVWKVYSEAGVNVYQAPLSWWEHNRHMTLAFSLNKAGGLTCMGGIYFRRRLKKSRIQPLQVDPLDTEDVAELILTFLSYVRRAYVEWEQRGGRGVDNQLLAFLDTCCKIGRAAEHPESVRDRINKVIEHLEKGRDSLALLRDAQN